MESETRGAQTTELQLLLAFTFLKHLEKFSFLILLFEFLQDTQDGFKTSNNRGKNNDLSKWDLQGTIHEGPLNLFWKLGWLLPLNRDF